MAIGLKRPGGMSFALRRLAYLSLVAIK